ncbi:hypothetical protein TH8_19765 [Thalassospira profundimaris]|nr:hypothetical protein TH8_19765 [Thalassospira profundimaris]
MPTFKFKMGQRVKMKESGETGEVIGRAEHKTSEPNYRVLYCAGDGRQVDCWWDESSLKAA